ncbi:MAG TPA: hypothetical protein VNU71_22135 [Burkholderiaceae bacterium]|nr:hypothetical protein [Burkholderiaceae bacterium]
MFTIRPDQVDAVRTCWPVIEAQFDEVVRTVVAERLEAEIAHRLMHDAMPEEAPPTPAAGTQH